MVDSPALDLGAPRPAPPVMLAAVIRPTFWSTPQDWGWDQEGQTWRLCLLGGPWECHGSSAEKSRLPHHPVLALFHVPRRSSPKWPGPALSSCCQARLPGPGPHPVCGWYVSVPVILRFHVSSPHRLPAFMCLCTGGLHRFPVPLSCSVGGLPALSLLHVQPPVVTPPHTRVNRRPE